MHQGAHDDQRRQYRRFAGRHSIEVVLAGLAGQKRPGKVKIVCHHLPLQAGALGAASVATCMASKNKGERWLARSTVQHAQRPRSQEPWEGGSAELYSRNDAAEGW